MITVTEKAKARIEDLVKDSNYDESYLKVWFSG